MIIPHWKDPNRKRKISISYNDKDYTKYYDIDSTDFEYLVSKLNNNERLTKEENDRYGIYIITICLIVLEHSKFKNKSVIEREEILEQQYMELLQYITGFNPNKGKLYSYAYRIAYTAACHYYTFKKKEKEEQEKIITHIKEEQDDYYDYHKRSDHKVNTCNYGNY